MNDMTVISVVAMVGWLFLAGSALASFQLGWSKVLQMALVWFAIFAGGFVIASFLM
ncbi:hypothetical protein [Erythrobacter sp. MTPC3]|uniref:hypothetical protein n=1 Tax=Erythrobacter sp. MTPC3 TaxID=3056564 RepID=UPI0036F1EE36